MDNNELFKNNNNESTDTAEVRQDAGAAPINEGIPADKAAPEQTAAKQPEAPAANEPQSAGPQAYPYEQAPQYSAASHQRYNPYAQEAPAQNPSQNYYSAQGGYRNPYQNGYANPTPQNDFSRYQNTASNYTQIPRDTVYINNQPEAPKKKKEKAPGKRIGFGAAAAIVAICMVFSGGAAFVGTYLANRLNGVTGGTDSEGNIITAAGKPSVIFQSYNNPNDAIGTYEQVAEAVAPTVVEITTESISTSSTFWGGSYVTSGAGSGVIISEDGLIVTNNHVVSGASTIKVTLKDGTEYTAKLIGADSDSDIAVIKVEGKKLPFALMGDSDKLTVGQEVVAVGNPLGELGGTVTNGIVSALSRDVNIGGTEMTLIQTNAAVNPGNSGGGLFNMYGELIGVVNAKSTSTSSGTSVEGIGFAIPINTATKVASERVNYGYVRGKVMLGISYVDVTSTYDAMRYGVNALGMYIAEKYEGFEVADRVTAVDGKEVTYGADVKSLLKNYKVGAEITITVVRKGQYVEVKVTLKEYVPEGATVTDEEQTSRFESNFESQSARH